MDVVCKVAAQHGREPIARVHDAIFFKHKLRVDLRHEIEMSMQEHSNNPYWRLAPKQIIRYESRYFDQQLEEAAHKLRIQQAEADAVGYKSPFWN
jgi:hypothetical protein